jgi:predicted Fe-S protein YdhL (DUF1289 family)
MNDARVKPSDEVASPCIEVCRVDPDTKLCEGCLRTLDEIAAWGSMSPAAKRATLARIEERRRCGQGTPR